MIDTTKLRAVAKKQGIETFYGLRKRYEKRGFITFGDRQAQRLWDGEGDPKQSTVDRLCLVLGCEPSDILEPLSAIKRAARNGHRA